MALGRPLGAKLFLEGKEVPFIGASITCTVNQASIAYIDLVPHKEIMNIKPRTLVQVFVRHYMDEGPECVFPYVLAWQGEVFGYTFGKTPSSRTFSLSCIDLTSYWDNCLAYFFNAQQSLGSGGTDKAAQAMEITDVKKTGTRIINVVLSQASYFKTKIEEIMKDTSKDFLDAFVAIYKDVSYVNDFFKAADERLRIKDQIVLHSSGKLYDMIKQTQALDWFTGMPGRSSGYSSLRSIIDDLTGMIFHDFAPIPFPAAVKSSNITKGLPTKNKTIKTIGNFVFKPNLYMMSPPACNIFFPDEYSNFQFSRNFFKEPTRLIYQPELPSRMGQGSPAVYMAHVYEPPSFDHFMSKATGDYADFQGNSSTDVPKGSNPGHWGENDLPNTSSKVNNGVKREAQFLTNEEYMKGIWLYRESMMPATTQFRMALDEYGLDKNKFSQRIAKYLFFKRRFQDRQLQITSHLKLSVVPGFPVLVLDDSDADQNVIAYCSSVTHRIYATEGGYTNVQLSYARYAAEQDVSSSFGEQYLIPPWFDELLFGEVRRPDDSEAAPEEVASLGVTVVASRNLSDFYASILGDHGSTALTSLDPKERVAIGAIRSLQKKYREKKLKGSRDVQAFISQITNREYIRMKDYFKFLGATTTEKDVNSPTANWIEFTGDIFTRKGKPDEKPVATRVEVIKKYRDTLKESRGFRG